jgi:metal-responsive CopG/Arc/MetJ family transcriptional regulator
VEQTPHVQTIQVVLDERLLAAADRTARRLKVNRSALIRSALRDHLRRLKIGEKEKRDRRGYESSPETAGEFGIWDKATAWPDE